MNDETDVEYERLWFMSVADGLFKRVDAVHREGAAAGSYYVPELKRAYHMGRNLFESKSDARNSARAEISRRKRQLEEFQQFVNTK